MLESSVHDVPLCHGVVSPRLACAQFLEPGSLPPTAPQPCDIPFRRPFRMSQPSKPAKRAGERLDLYMLFPSGPRIA